ALRLDEHYAEAMVGLAMVRFGLPIGVRADTEVDKARELIERAIALDPRLASAYVARATIERQYDFDWAAAQASLKRARELEPGNFGLLIQAGFLAETVGRFDESDALIRQGLEHDPLFAEGYLTLGRIQMAAGKDAAAAASWRKYAELAPAGFAAHY